MRRHVSSLALLISAVAAACGGTSQRDTLAATESPCEAEFRRVAARDHTLGRGRGLDEAT
jgi:hypothetical protein